MKRWPVILTLAIFSAVPASPDELTAEEAQYQALYTYMTAANWTARTEEGFEGRASAPRTYENYGGSRRYYLCYVYDGPGEMPPWEDLEALAAAGEPLPAGVHGFFIPASAAEAPYTVPAGRLVDPTLRRRRAEKVASLHFGGEPAAFVRTVVENSFGEFALFYEYRAGEATVLINEAGLVVPPPGFEETADEEPPPAETIKNQQREEAVRDVFKPSWLE